MRRPAQLALLAVAVLLLGATGVFYQKYRKTSSDLTSVKASEEAARNQYSQTINAIAEIQDSLNSIALGDTNVRMLPGDLGAEQRMTEGNSRRALDQIALLRAAISRSKERIRLVETRLKKSGLKVAGLERMVANLKHSVSEKEDFIAQLSSRVDSLQTQVTGLVTQVQETQDTVRAKDEALEARRREVATVYYVAGKKKELMASGVIVAKGGVLGLGKTLQPSGHINDGQLTALDTDQEQVIQLPSQKAKVLSAQPVSSYELRLVDGRMELHILDPQEFRKVRQLVILTA